MQISNILSGFTDALTLGKKTESTAAAKVQVQPTADAQSAAPPGTRKAMAEIVAQYDVTRITPSAYSEMLQKLRAAGAISDAELQELSVVRLDLERAGVSPDETVDWLEKFREIQLHPDSAGMELTA